MNQWKIQKKEKICISGFLMRRKPETQTLGGVGNLTFFRTVDIKEMAAIFQFFNNGQC